MFYFLCSNIFIKINDINNVWIDSKRDKIYFKMKCGLIKSSTNGVELFKEFKEIKKISDLRQFMHNNEIKPSWLARKIGVTPPAICNLYSNTTISNSLHGKILKYFPNAFNEDIDFFKNPLI